MITNRQSFDYLGKKILERATIIAPFKLERVFPNDGCFLYFKNGKTTIRSSEDSAFMNGSQAVLLQCGTYFLDFMRDFKGDSTDVIAVHLYPEILKKIYSKELPSSLMKGSFKKKNPIIQPNKVIIKYIESLEFYFDNPSLVNDDLLELKMKELILLLLQTKSVDSIIELIYSFQTTRTTEIKKIVDLHLYSNLSIEELAKLSNLSISSFNRKFKEDYKDTPRNYIQNQKILKAEELLSLSTLSVGQIAFECGFNDPLYFTRVFKKKNGHTPSEFRAQSQTVS